MAWLPIYSERDNPTRYCVSRWLEIQPSVGDNSPVRKSTESTLVYWTKFICFDNKGIDIFL